MMPNALLASYLRTMHVDRDSSGLRRYVRDEWGSQSHWIPRSAPSAPLRERLGHWLRKGRARTNVPRPVAEPASLSLPSSRPPVRDEEACPHLVHEELGLGGDAVFLRCSRCGEVLIVSEGRVWGLTGADAPAAPDPSCA